MFVQATLLFFAISFVSLGSFVLLWLISLSNYIESVEAVFLRDELSSFKTEMVAHNGNYVVIELFSRNIAE